MRKVFYGKILLSFGLASTLISCGGGGEKSSSNSNSDSIFPQLAHIVHGGQSLAQGAESFPLISSKDTGWGNYQFSRGVLTWRNDQYGQVPENRPASDFNLAPLVSGIGETIGNGLTDQLKSLINTDTRFLFSYSGEGGRRLRDMDKRHDDAANPLSSRQTVGGHYKTSIDDVRRGKEQANKLGLTYGVPAITWMQGEAETLDLKINDWTPALSRDEVIKTYVTDLINLKNDWNEDIRAITGQTKPIPMFTYQTLGAVAGQAQLVATDLDPNIYMVSPTYYMYTAYNAEIGNAWGHWIHIDGDSERWLGAQFAKVMQRVLVNKEKWQPLRPLKAWANTDKTTVYVQYAVPRKPLVVDTNFLPKVQGFGFTIPNGPTVSDISVINDDTIALKLSAPLPANSTLQYADDDASTKVTDMPPILAVRSGANWKNGQPSYEIVFSGDIRPLLAPLKYYGAFYLKNNLSTTENEIAVIREVSLDSDGNTILRGEPRELWTGASFKPGQATTINTIFYSGNIHDSDNFNSIYKFFTGPRQGQSYPMWNWGVSFAQFPIN